jgi:hypothetical protein
MAVTVRMFLDFKVFTSVEAFSSDTLYCTTKLNFDVFETTGVYRLRQRRKHYLGFGNYLLFITRFELILQNT